jgi:signal transduction histidine kinase/ActR/RegA family two-component response regulator
MNIFHKISTYFRSSLLSSDSDLKIHAITLSFTGESQGYEPLFQKEYFNKSLLQVRFSLVLAIFFFGIFAVLDAILVRELRITFWIIRIIVVIPGIILFILSYNPGFEKYWQAAISILIFFAGLGIVYMTIISSASEGIVSYTYYTGLILIFIFGYALMRVRFIWATIACWSIVISYEIAAIWLTDTPTVYIISNNSFFISANVIGMFVSYSIESYTRRDFFLARMLEKERIKVIEAKDELEKRVEERTSQLAQTNKDLLQEIENREKVEKEQARLEAQLYQSQKMETVGTLAGGIAHDFNNILTPILGYTEMALDEIKTAGPIKSDLEQIFKAANRAKELVQQILTFSKQQDQDIKPIEFHTILDEVLTLLRASLPSTIEIKQKNRLAKGVILADPTQIHQVIMNICINAFQSMEESGGILEISLENAILDRDNAIPDTSLQKGKYLKLTIRDVGSGMDNETKGRIFEPFFTKRKVGEGTGLGLSVVHGIVTGYNGGITVESVPEKGTSFTVYFPEYDKRILKRKLQNYKLIKGKEHILFVDDEKDITTMANRMLSRLGYVVTTISDSVNAYDEFMKQPELYDLVITDQVMPNMMGSQLATKIRQIKPDIKIIIITGYSDSISAEKIKELGFNGFIIKPLILRDLSNTIRNVIEND